MSSLSPHPQGLILRGPQRLRRSIGFLRAVLIWGGLLSVAAADVAVPPRVLDPQSAVEAWNVIRLVRINTARLLRENRLSEIPVQISLCSPALRALGGASAPAASRASLGDLTTRGMASINAVAAASIAGDRSGVERSFTGLEAVLDEAARFFPAGDVNAEIAVCPMHPDNVTPNLKAPCAKCGMDLIARRIPYSFIYTQPGEPSVVLTAKPAGPLVAGQKVQVEIELKSRAGEAITPGDLMVMHTERIHLLIIDPSLEDYHHEHPVETDKPGRYVFSFTPARSGPYRIFADLVPVNTSVQEYPFCDLAGATAGEAISPAAATFTSSVGNLRFDLAFPGLNGAAPRAGQIQNMTISVSDAGGQPVQRLEPVMNAFAHVVGFHEDHLTVLHLHPTGGDVLRQDLRGGPSMGFKFFPPKSGFVRLFCQVFVDGKMIFAPFNVHIAP